MINEITNHPWVNPLLGANCNSVNILFIGDLSSPGRLLACQAFAEYLHYATEPARLVLAFDASTPEALKTLDEEATRLDIREALDIVVIDSAAHRFGLYRMANLLLLAQDFAKRESCAREATCLSLPVAHLLETEEGVNEWPGLQLLQSAPAELAAMMRAILRQRGVRRRLVADQYASLSALFPPEERAWKIEGPFDSSYSLAIVNRELARALTRLGQRVILDITPGSTEPQPDSSFLAQNDDIRELCQRAQDGGWSDVVMRNTYPPSTAAMQARIRVMQSYGWEETGFPERYVNWFNNNLDIITVVSRLVGKILRDAGIRIPIVVVGNGGDQTDTTRPDAPPPCSLGKPYRFLHISTCLPRKGIDILLAAWGKAFRASDPVSLIIKTYPNPHNDAAEQLAACLRADPEYPDVIVINQEWPQDQINALYRRCHVYVAPSRGEGFGLPFMEAMRFGLPLIVTAWGGQTDFVSDDNAWLIDYKFAAARTHLDAGHSAWAEPDVEHLAKLMREVYTAPQHVLRAKTQRARQMAARHTWDGVATRTRQGINRLEAAPQIANDPRVGWISSWNTRCGIASYSGYLVSAFPESQVEIFANHDDASFGGDAANVRRCWKFGQIDALREALRAASLDAIVIQHHPAFLAPAQLGALIEDALEAGRQTHLFFHKTLAFEYLGVKSQFIKQLPTFAKATRIYVHGIDDLNNLKKFGLIDNVTLFPHGIPAFPTGDRELLRARQGLQNKRVIATYGFLMPHKGARQLVEALHHLLPDYPDLHLILCCAIYPNQDSHNENLALDELIQRLELAEHVTRLHDYLPEEESLEWLQMADLLVFAYQNTEESSSAAVRMGLSSGQPIAVTPLPIFDDLGDVVSRLPGARVEELVAGLRVWLQDPRQFCARQRELAPRYCQRRAWPSLSLRLSNIIHGLANSLPGET
jgi:glycosyltransferase involved in cell wall biosynthesis